MPAPPRAGRAPPARCGPGGRGNAHAPPAVRVAVLNCPGAAPFTPLFEAMFDAGAERGTARVSVAEYLPSERQLPDLESYDAYAITGSRHGSYESLDWIDELKDWVCEARRRNARLLGVCFGHQIVADALAGGGAVEVNPNGFEFGVYAFKPTEDFISFAKDTYGVPPPPTSDKAIDMFYVHGDHVSPAGLERLATKSDGLRSIGGTDVSPCEGLYDHACGGRVLTLQGHPEFDVATMEACHGSLTRAKRLPAAMPGDSNTAKADLLARQLAGCTTHPPQCQAWLHDLVHAFLTADVK